LATHVFSAEMIFGTSCLLPSMPWSLGTFDCVSLPIWATISLVWGLKTHTFTEVVPMSTPRTYPAASIALTEQLNFIRCEIGD
jgi:hypothetical protein